jgi:predicted dehydrogenase
MITLALIGNGVMGKRYLKTIKKIPDAQIKYVFTHDYKNILKYTDIDGIIIATPDKTHAEIIKSFPDRYLLVEKPFVTDLKDALEIKNRKIMVGYTYLYDEKIEQQFAEVQFIDRVKFVIRNTKKVENTNALWYLGTHGVAVALYYFGLPKSATVVPDEKGNLFIKFVYKKAIFYMEVGWNYQEKYRSVEVYGSKLMIPKNPSKFTPLENQLMAFVKATKRGFIKTDLGFARFVTKVLSKIEYPLLQKIY